MRRALLTPLAAVAIVVGLVGLSFWRPWDARERERELAWVRGLATWVEVDHAAGRLSCERSFDEQVGNAPTRRLERLAATARKSCRPGLEGARRELVYELVEGHSRDAETVEEADLGQIASSIAGRRVRAHCWADDSEWSRLQEQWGLLVAEEFWISGFASPGAQRIDLARHVCAPLRLFFRSDYAPVLNVQSFELAEALVVLAHEAEHIRTPYASEAVVECYALQRVRPVVLRAGRRRPYARELSLIAWDLGYPNLPGEYRTENCHDGGPFDLDPGSRVWP